MSVLISVTMTKLSIGADLVELSYLDIEFHDSLTLGCGSISLGALGIASADCST